MINVNWVFSATILFVAMCFLGSCGDVDAYQFSTGDGETKVVVVNSNPVLADDLQTSAASIPFAAEAESIPHWDIKHETKAKTNDIVLTQPFRVECKSKSSDVLTAMIGPTAEEWGRRARSSAVADLESFVAKTCIHHRDVRRLVDQAFAIAESPTAQLHLTISGSQDDRDSLHFDLTQVNTKIVIRLSVDVEAIHWLAENGPAISPQRPTTIVGSTSEFLIQLVDQNQSVITSDETNFQQPR